jgi:microcystin-dependent protein
MANYEATKYDFDGANLTGIEECNGSAVSRTTYATLFGIVGTTYGVGDGSTTFNVPDLADNVPVGKSPGKALASTGGANTVAVTAAGNVGGSTANATLSTAQLASHSHPLRIGSGPNIGMSNPYDVGVMGGTSPQSNNSTIGSNTGSGSGHSHNMSATFSGNAVNASIVQPYLTLIYIIKT